MALRPKSDSEILINMINATYAIALSAAKSDERKAQLQEEKQRAIEIAKENPAGLRSYHMVVLNNSTYAKTLATNPRDILPAMRELLKNAMRATYSKAAKSLRRSPSIDQLDRSVEPAVNSTAISQRVLSAMVDVDAGQAVPAAAETQQRPQSFTFQYGIPPRSGHVQGFSSMEDLVEEIANGKRSPALERVLNLLLPRQDAFEVAAWTLTCRLLESIGKRMVQPISNQQFLNLQIYMIAGIKQVRPEIDPDDAYERFAEDMANRLKGHAQQTGAPETKGLGDLENVVAVTEGRASRETQNRDIIQRAGLAPEQPPAEVINLFRVRLDKAERPRPPLSPQRIEEIVRQLPTKPTDPA